jgi:hypothetical protein
MANPAKVIPLPVLIDNILSNLLKTTAASVASKLEEIDHGYNTSAFLPSMVKDDTRYIEALIKYQETSDSNQFNKLPLQPSSEFSKQLLELLLEWQANQIQHHLKDIRKIFEQKNLATIFSQEESFNILIKGQQKYRLLVLVSPPNVSPNCPSSFQHDLQVELPEKLRAFLHKDYPAHSDLCPVDFYDEYFNRSISDADLIQLQQILAPVPTVVLHSKITDYEVYFHVNFWHPQNSNIVKISLPAWNWEEVKESLYASDRDEIRAIRIIRQIIVTIHQLLAAFIVDWYYLYLNHTYEPQLFHLESELALSRWSSDLLKPYIDTLKNTLEQKQVCNKNLSNLTDDKYAPITEDTTESEQIIITNQYWEISEEDIQKISTQSGIYYSKLRYLLSEKNWREADEETSKIIFNIASQYRKDLALETATTNEMLLPSQCISNFSCEELRIIDKLWLNYSNMHFGLSTQTCLWQTISHNQADLNLICKDFVTQVGWLAKHNQKNYEGIIYQLDAPLGHLPFAFTKLFSKMEVENWGCWYDFYHRLQICELKNIMV